MRLALFTSTFPVRSETFVHREARVLEGLGHAVTPFCLRAPLDPPDEARDLADRTDALYGDRRALVGDLAAEFAAAPLRSLGTLATAVRDACTGRFSSFRQRAIAPVQALTGVALGRRLRRAGVDHLHVHFAHAPATVAMYAARQAGLPLSIVGHARDLFVEGSLLREKAARSTVFGTISEAARTRLVRERSLDPETLEVLPCGVDTDVFAPDGSGPLAGRLVAVGRLVEKKGFEDLIDALGRSRHENVSLTLIGDGPLRASLEQRAERLGVRDRIEFTGALERTKILEALRRAEVFVLPSRTATDGDEDGVPVVLLEAMATGLPVVTTRLAGIPELVEDDVHGRLVEAGDVAALTLAIDGLLGDPARAATMGLAGRLRTVRERRSEVLAARLARRLTGREPLQAALPARTAPPAGRRVVLITPARDEAHHLPRLARSIEAQTLRPAAWVIVDDGSTDGMGEIADRLAERHDWIRVVHRGDRGARKLGGGVIEAFDAGYANVDLDHDYVAKLDADLSFEPGYLERLLAEFEADARLGSASGKVFRPERGGLVEEFMIDAMVAGQFKLYRRACFEAIGGFVREVMWDGIDFHRSRMHGWGTRSFDAPELRLVHHRLMGSSDRSVYRGRLRWGRGQWFMGSHPAYLIASAALRMLEKPYVVGGALIVAGYLRAALERAPRYADRAFRRELQRWQVGRLVALAARGQVR